MIKKVNKDYRQVVYNLLIFYALTADKSFNACDISVAKTLECEVNDYPANFSFESMIQDFAEYYDVSVNDIKEVLRKGRAKLIIEEA